MLDREGREVRIGNEIGAHSCLSEDSGQHFSMALGRRGNPGRFTIEPFLDLVPSGAD